jgi:cellulose synthase (UDP-forming)
LVRKSYLEFLEKAASDIHQLDSIHPVISSLAASPELVIALKHYNKYVPSIDVTGICVYKEESIVTLNEVISHYDPYRPYMIMEFGVKPYEYDSEEYFAYEEDSDSGKGDRFYWQWIKYIEAYQGNNLGGIAYCWRDTPLGIRTWFGITDYKDRVKASYFELKKVYTKKFNEMMYPTIYIDGPKENFARGGIYKFKAGSIDGHFGLFKKHEWFLVPESNKKQVNSVLVNKKPSEVTVTLPDEPGKYRLYLYIADDYGRVVTASKAIYVY